MNNRIGNQANLTTWAIIAIIGLLALNGYQWYSNSKIKKENNQNKAYTLELSKAQAELEKDYLSALENLEELKGDNKDLNDLIDSQKKELASQKEKINELIWTKRELNKAKEEIKNLNSMASGYVTQINKLKEENLMLAESNRSLTDEKEMLSSNFEMQLKLNKELEEVAQTLEGEKKRLATSNESLSGKVDIANAIKINWMHVEGYEYKKNGELKRNSKAKDIEVLRTCIKTETNLVTDPGPKDFYVRLITDNGETIAKESDGSGILWNKLDDTQIRYTYSGKVDYRNQDTEACLDWVVSDPLPKGPYDIEIYNNGFLVGKGNFRLK
ncbi:MAG TPA: hypothetical protein PKC30_08220 [Saprospiraceae bacterium]|nr:hypothetical protein [Saprospiraceae bacterium]